MRGVSRSMMCSCVMCGEVCTVPEVASGCVILSFVREWALRVLVWELQFLQWESEQSNRSDVGPKGHDMLGFPGLFCDRGA